MRRFSITLIAAALALSAGQALAADDGGRRADVVKLATLEAIMSGTTEPDRRTRVAVTCFRTGERISGTNKICFYDCLGSEVEITIKSDELCALAIHR